MTNRKKMNTSNNIHSKKKVQSKYYLRSNKDNANNAKNYYIENNIIHKLYDKEEISHVDDTIEVCKYIKYFDKYAVEQLSVIEYWSKDPAKRNEEINDNKCDKSKDMYSCNICNNYGPSGHRCGRCGEDTNSIFSGRKMSDTDCKEAKEYMKQIDIEDGRYDWFQDRIEGCRKVILIDLRGNEPK